MADLVSKAAKSELSGGGGGGGGGRNRVSQSAF
jgi:hypothetical protein